MIKTFEQYETTPLPDFGNILHLKIEDIKVVIPFQKIYVMLDYNAVPLPQTSEKIKRLVQLYSYSKKELFNITPKHLNNDIRDGLVIYDDVEDIFKINPQLVVNLYKEMKKLLHKGQDELGSDNPYIDIFNKLHNDWMNKLPDLKYHLEADTYNL